MGHVCNSITLIEARIQAFINKYFVINKKFPCITEFMFLTSVTTFTFIDHNKNPQTTDTLNQKHWQTRLRIHYLPIIGEK